MRKLACICCVINSAVFSSSCPIAGLLEEFEAMVGKESITAEEEEGEEEEEEEGEEEESSDIVWK